MKESPFSRVKKVKYLKALYHLSAGEGKNQPGWQAPFQENKKH